MNAGGPDPSASMGGGASQEDRTQAMLCWILGIFLWILSPVIFMLVGKDKPHVYRNSMQCLTFQLFLAVLAFVLGILSIPLGFITCGLGFGIVILPWILDLLFSIMGAIAANNGQVYEPPITGPWAKSLFKV